MKKNWIVKNENETKIKYENKIGNTTYFIYESKKSGNCEVGIKTMMLNTIFPNFDEAEKWVRNHVDK